ncbi:MAG TPA: cytochrome c oxidase subunit I, partial [Phycisphaerales bacterium]|nr:cytochrome c oxidase subunit I [Phycisphaerales bacterium]
MTSNPTPHAPELPQEQHNSNDNYLNHTKGFTSWAFTIDHKRIGIMYGISICTFLLVGGLFALALRTMLAMPIANIANHADKAKYPQEYLNWWMDMYNHMFTLHGAVMVFMFIIPGIPAVLGNFVLPLMLGAKDVAFPKLNLASFHIFVIGSVLLVWVLLKGVLVAAFPGLAHYIGHGGLETGWTFYTPYSMDSNSAVVEATLGAFVLGFSSILTAVNFIASMHMLRPKGMGWFKMPLFLWSLYGTAIIQLLATPVLAITLMLLIAERAFRVGIFDPNLDGDPILYQHFFWFYSHPAVYIMILPAMGVISELVTAHSRKHIFGYKFIAYSSIAIALLGFFVWGHHMFTSGQSAMANAVFSLLTFSVSIPSAIKVFNWLSTMYRGEIHLRTPMLYVLAFILLFAIGGLTGLFLGALAVDIHLHDTYFIVAHFHYVMMGSALIAFLGGMYHWWPKMTGKMYSEKWGAIGCAMIFVGFNLTFFIQFIAGSQGMPR